MGVPSEESSAGFSFPRNLSVWWSEETDYLLQRIERWAAYARGYNRLRSVRLSPGRMTMHEEPDDTSWTINRTTNRLVVDANNWSPSFRQQRRSQQPLERSRLRGCCAFDYKANGNLDTSCLEAYSLDHSIYFKTIGDIKSDKNTTTTNIINNNNNIDPEDRSSTVTRGSTNTSTSSNATTPLDCGDFLSSDFDELDEEEEEELDGAVEADLELRQQLEQLQQRASYELGPEVIQVCRSVISEEEINNNFTRTGFPRSFPRKFAQPAQ